MMVSLRFDARLSVFVRRSCVSKALREKASIKDVIESCGVPHTEVDGIIADEREVNFRFGIERDSAIEVFGFPAPVAQPLQRRGVTRFVADGHLGKLVRRLRLLGFDVRYGNDPRDAELVAIAHEEGRALLTRDRRLLMHAAVETGYWLRSQFADEQAAEVIARFDLREAVRPFARCANCNGELAPVAKDEVFAQLEPLTKIYYDEFRRCRACGQIYWAGSHAPKLKAQLARVLARR